MLKNILTVVGIAAILFIVVTIGIDVYDFNNWALFR
jgi:hypothetical protein